MCFLYAVVCLATNRNNEICFRYASLYFCCAIEQSDNELLCLEIIHRYVELLDRYFGSVSVLISLAFIV